MKKRIIFMMGFMLLFPLIVNAAAEDVNIVCDSNTLVPGAQTTCYIKGDFSKNISSFHGELSADTNLTISNITKSGWEGSGDGGIIDLYTDTNKTGTFNFVTFVVEADSNVSNVEKLMYLKNISISDDSFNEEAKNDKNYEIKITSVNNSNQEIEKADNKEEKANNKEEKANNPKTGSNDKYYLLFIFPIALVVYLLLKKKSKFVRL